MGWIGWTLDYRQSFASANGGRWFFVQASTRRQVSVALSSAEAELAAAVAATTEAIGTRPLYRTMSEQEPGVADPVRGVQGLP